VSAWRAARAPGSSANLGPGFDALAIAVPLEVRVWARPGCRSTVRLAGTGSGEAIGAGHLIARAIAEVGSGPSELVVDSAIPLARGLGSSGALAVALAAALGAADPLRVAVALEGHPENVAASVAGGAVVALEDGDAVLVRRIPLDRRLRLVLVVPEWRLSTTNAREVLPERVTRADVVFNLQRAAALAVSLADVGSLAPTLFADRLHEPYRGVLFPEAEVIRAALLGAGCRGATWSGAGTTMVGFVDEAAVEEVAARTASALEQRGIKAAVRAVAPDADGLVVKEGEPPEELLALPEQPVAGPSGG
jgi:homoserine kinase